jgi:hypothetical protein
MTRAAASAFSTACAVAAWHLLVASALDQNVEHDAGLVYGAPQPMLHPGDLEYDLVWMPLVASLGQAATDLIGEALAELERPLPHGFVADADAARGQQLLHHAQPERKAEIQPHGGADDLGGKPMALVAGARGGRHSTRLPTLVSQRNPPGHAKLTVPSGLA